jgi:hypothetical protein
MRLKARILIEIDTRDFVDATGHKKKIEDIFKIVKGRYRQASLDFRQPFADARAASGPLRHYTGRMCEYEE